MTDTLLSKAYHLATRLKELAPWTYMDETEIFGVHIPGTDTQYFVSIMGSAGEHYGMAAYQGTQGLHGFWELQEFNTWVRPGELLLIPHLLVSFENRDMIEPKDRETMKRLGFSFRGQNAWPDFRHIIPGYVPLMPEGEALSHLVIVLEQSIKVLERVKTNPEILYNEKMDQDEYMVRTTDPSDPGHWKDTCWRIELPEKQYQMDFIKMERDKISGLPRSKEILQVDIAFMPMQVAEKGEKAYFASMFMAMSKHYGTILHYEMLSPVDGVPEMHARFPDLLIKTLLKLKFQPPVIEIRHPVFYEMAKKVLHPTKIKILLKPVLEYVEDALESFESENR